MFSSVSFADGIAAARANIAFANCGVAASST